MLAAPAKRTGLSRAEPLSLPFGLASLGQETCVTLNLRASGTCWLQRKTPT